MYLFGQDVDYCCEGQLWQSREYPPDYTGVTAEWTEEAESAHEKEKARETLCWSCTKAEGQCCWSDGRFLPVPGWEAQKSCFYDWTEEGGCLVESYQVFACPEYQQEEERCCA